MPARMASRDRSSARSRLRKTKSDSAAEQLWEQGGSQLKPLLGQRWDAVDAALRGFDFDGALQLLRELAPSAAGGQS